MFVNSQLEGSYPSVGLEWNADFKIYREPAGEVMWVSL